MFFVLFIQKDVYCLLIIYQFTEDIKSRTEFNYDFNYELRKYCKDNNIKYVEVFNELLTSEGILDFKFIDKQINDHHLKGVGEHSVKYDVINKLFENYVLKLKNFFQIYDIKGKI